MSSFASALWGVIGYPPEPLALILYEGPLDREDLIAEIRSLAPDGIQIAISTNINDAFTKLNQLVLLKLSDTDEPDALRELAGRRDALVDRQQPAILFLLRRGQAIDLFKNEEFAGLWSWVANHILEPRALRGVNVPIERESFQKGTGQSPEVWLSAWRNGKIPDTLDNTLWFHRALSLVTVNSDEQ